MTTAVLALDAFLNSALREGRLRDAREEPGALRFRDARGREVRVPVRARSTWRRCFGADCALRQAGNWRPVSIETLLSDLAGEGGATFRARVLDSLAAIETADWATGDPERWSFAEGEQALLAGHAFHPNPRSRDGMTGAEVRRYAPERRGRFALHWVAVDPALLTLSAGAAERMRALAEADLGTLPARGVPVPWHPWQARRLLDRADLRAHLAAGRLTDLGPGTAAWRATSSMRSLHGFHAPYMLKTSLSLRLTNSVRDLSLREVVRGIHITDLLGSALGRRIRSEFPTLRLLAEPGYVALNDAAGAPIEQTISVLRDNPFRDAARPGPVMLAALCEPGPDGRSPLGRIVARLGPGTGAAWFARFLAVAVLPLLELRARHGLLFGAHQQNMMLDLKDGWPAAAWIRDCQGTGHLRAFHGHLTAACPAIGEGSENVVDADLGDGLVTYYVVVNGVLNTMATLVLDGLAWEAALLEVWREALRRARAETPGDPTLYDKLLTRPTLTCKGNFATSLSGVNEADGDARGQLAAFLEIPNPLKETVGA
ncbi:IucA/IucC family protein [Jannaschia marina]|uniref:IucA/IucC family protein n=1 Tax=Jannaschia marina TaxID=2741674 RepID=UPI0015C978D1|nr:IucA/IucC family protein [Jannaschia marina]